jgi:D-ribose pyranase
MKKDGILNENLLRLIGSLGHTDQFTISDVGLPIPKNVEKIDLAITKGKLAFLDVLKPILEEVVIEKIILAKELKIKSPEMYSAILKLTGNIVIEEVIHEDFKILTANSKAVVRTGECTPYTNIILQSGVNFS